MNNAQRAVPKASSKLRWIIQLRSRQPHSHADVRSATMLLCLLHLHLPQLTIFCLHLGFIFKLQSCRYFGHSEAAATRLLIQEMMFLTRRVDIWNLISVSTPLLRLRGSFYDIPCCSGPYLHSKLLQLLLTHLRSYTVWKIYYYYYYYCYCYL